MDNVVFRYFMSELATDRDMVCVVTRSGLSCREEANGAYGAVGR